MLTNIKLNITPSVNDIPNLDPPLFYEKVDSQNGMDRIILPSGHTAYHIKRYDHVKSLLLDRRFIREPSNRPNGPSVFPTLTPKDLLLNTDGPNHIRLKKIVLRDFSPTGIGNFKPIFDLILSKKIYELSQKNRQADLFKDFLDFIPPLGTCALLGIDPNDLEYFRQFSYTVQIANKNDITTLVDHFEKIYSYQMNIVTGERKVSPHAFVQKALNMRNDATPPYTDEELSGVLIAVLLGSDHNILSLLTKMIYVLLTNPILYEALTKNPKLIPNAIEELFRLIPLGLVSAFPRISSEDINTSWGFFPKDSALYPDVFQANRDLFAYKNPLLIDFNRIGPRHLQFGYGMHACMGTVLARMEINAVIEALIKNFPTLRLTINPEDVIWQDGLIIRRPVSLPVCW